MFNTCSVPRCFRTLIHIVALPATTLQSPPRPQPNTGPSSPVPPAPLPPSVSAKKYHASGRALSSGSPGDLPSGGRSGRGTSERCCFRRTGAHGQLKRRKVLAVGVNSNGCVRLVGNKCICICAWLTGMCLIVRSNPTLSTGLARLNLPKRVFPMIGRISSHSQFSRST